MEIVKPSRAVLLGRELEKVISTDDISCKGGKLSQSFAVGLRSNAYGDIGSTCLARKS